MWGFLCGPSREHVGRPRRRCPAHQEQSVPKCALPGERPQSSLSRGSTPVASIPGKGFPALNLSSWASVPMINPPGTASNRELLSGPASLTASRKEFCTTPTTAWFTKHPRPVKQEVDDWDTRFSEWGFAPKDLSLEGSPRDGHADDRLYPCATKSASGKAIQAADVEVPTVRLHAGACIPAKHGGRTRTPGAPAQKPSSLLSNGSEMVCSSGASAGGPGPGIRKQNRLVINSIPDRLVLPDTVVLTPTASATASHELDMLQRRQTAQLFSFMRETDGASLVPHAGHFMWGPLRDFHRLDEETLLGEPTVDDSRLAKINVPQTQLLRCVLQAYAQVPCPLGLVSTAVDPGAQRCLTKSAFCRFLLDSKLLWVGVQAGGRPGGCAGAGALPYHRATRLFDASVRAPNSSEARSPSEFQTATIDQSIVLVRHLLAVQTSSPEELEKFFSKNLLEAQYVAQALLAKSETSIMHAAAAKEEPMHTPASNKLTCEWDPPAHFRGTANEWSQGMELWRRTINEQSGAGAAVHRVEQHFALECYISDMLIDPGSLHFGAVFCGLFQEIFETYADGERVIRKSVPGKEEAEERETAAVRHMSFAVFFRFCLDFAVFPELCSFDDARAAYDSVECLLKSAASVPGRRQARASRGSSQRLTRGSTRKSMPVFPPAASSTRPLQRSIKTDLPLAFDLVWIKKDFTDMSDHERDAYKLLNTLHECSADHFLSVGGLFLLGAEGSGSQQKHDGHVGVDEILNALHRWHVIHTFRAGGVLDFMRLVNPQTDGTMRVSDLEKAVCLVCEDQRQRQKRLRGSTVGGATPPGVHSRKSALGNEARRFDNQGLSSANTHGQNCMHLDQAFGHEAFMEGLLRICFRHLLGSGTEVKVAIPPSLKGLWLVTFLHFQFDRLLRAQRSSPPPRQQGFALQRADRGMPEGPGQPGQASLHSTSGPPSVQQREAPSGRGRPEGTGAGDVQYSPCLVRLLDSHPGLFQRYTTKYDAASDRDEEAGPPMVREPQIPTAK